jgi:hypothetical protein
MIKDFGPPIPWSAQASHEALRHPAHRKLTIQDGEVFSGEVSGDFKEAEPLKFLPGTPPTN